MVLLAGSSAIAAQFFCTFFCRFSRSEALQVDAGQIVVTLLATQLGRFALGLGVRHW